MRREDLKVSDRQQERPITRLASAISQWTVSPRPQMPPSISATVQFPLVKRVEPSGRKINGHRHLLIDVVKFTADTRGDVSPGTSTRGCRSTAAAAARNCLLDDEENAFGLLLARRGLFAPLITACERLIARNIWPRDLRLFG